MDIIGKILPCLVGLIIVDARGEDGKLTVPHEQISTPDIRRETLSLFNGLITNNKFKSMVIGYLTQEGVRRELHRLKVQVKEQEHKKNQKHKNINPLPTEADLNPLDEEVSKYIKNIAAQMSLEIRDVFSDLENSGEDDYTDIDLDLDLDIDVGEDDYTDTGGGAHGGDDSIDPG